MDPRHAHIALNRMDDIGPVRVRALVECFGSIEAIFKQDAKGLARAKGVGQRIADSIVAQRDHLDVEAEIKGAEQLGARIITPLDDEYPKALREIHDPPLALYVMGTLEERDHHGMAVIGSRRCSHYGRQVADRLSYQLGKVGFAVISGLARGIDEAAHEGCLKGGGRTLAVLGSSIDELYPPESAALAEKIAEQGAVLSEFPLGTKPNRTTFPMRNRIVSGMALGVLVVEAGTNSGAMITADEAAAQGRPVFAVPGRIDAPHARGCHKLIKSGAKLVETVDDVIEEFEYLIAPSETRSARPEPAMSPEEAQIREALHAGTLNVDDLARITGIPVAKVSGLLIGLEMKRVVRMLPGRTVELTHPNAG